MVLEDDQAGGDCEDQGLEVRQGSVSYAANVDGCEETEHVLGGLWELPELRRVRL